MRKQILTAALCLAACPALAQTFTLTAVPYYTTSSGPYALPTVIEPGLTSLAVCNSAVAPVVTYAQAVSQAGPKLPASAVGFCTPKATVAVPGGTLALDTYAGTYPVSLRITEPTAARCQADIAPLAAALAPMFGSTPFYVLRCV